MNPWMFRKISTGLIALFFVISFFPPVFAQEYSQDISINPGDVRVSDNLLKGESARIYVTVRNNSTYDLSGVVKFYDEKIAGYLGFDQPVSILANKTDDVFIDWTPDSLGDHKISVRVIPWSEDGDNPDNNKQTVTVYVDRDSDGDGTGDRLDNDDDNDGVPDRSDALPLNSSESVDTDGDKIGDNADTDDDNDGVPDAEDAFPLDSSETKDTDHDGVGDNADVFPFDLTESADSDSDGLGDNADTDDENHGPIPAIDVTTTRARAGETVTFNALKSKDPDGEVVDFKWDFGDGFTDTGVIVGHVFERSGGYDVTLRVTDDKNEYRELQIQILVGYNFYLALLIGSGIILLLLLLLLFIPSSRFHHRRLRNMDMSSTDFSRTHVE